MTNGRNNTSAAESEAIKARLPMWVFAWSIFTAVVTYSVTLTMLYAGLKQTDARLAADLELLQQELRLRLGTLDGREVENKAQLKALETIMGTMQRQLDRIER